MVFQLQLTVLLLQLIVLAPNAEQDEVVFHEAPCVAAHEFQPLLHGRHRGDCPDADQRDILIALDLIRDEHELRRDHDQEDCQIAITAEEEIHNTTAFTPAETLRAASSTAPSTRSPPCAAA